ncbi:MAG: methylmalonyl-CoA carboxyltransferase [Bacteroidetes bacterium]|nr:MAG: methylmalonyl-CoA carboxyltransferase [Bacteroidota bacterium]PIE88162.1 MAG: methylmalonyl-CoA carboxyltransferase [Bacteroidota bacterium]
MNETDKTNAKKQDSGLSRSKNILQVRKKIALQGGGTKAIEKQKATGKLTARERILALVDKGSFHEYDLFVEHAGRDFDMDKKYLPGDGVVTGTGTINGYPVCVFAQDFTVAGGSLGYMHAKKITKIMDHAMKLQVPLIGINDSGGARIQEGVNSLAGYGEIFYRNTQASGVIPQISVILGPCAGGAVYSPALTDFVFVVDKISKMFITGPEVIKTVLGEEISMEDLGGAKVHAELTGNAHFYAESEIECFEQIKNLVSYIPWNNNSIAKPFPKKPPKTRHYKIEDIFPENPKQPYDVRNIIRALSDSSEFMEIQEKFAANITIGFGRMEGKTVGFVANQPLVLAGVLDVDSSDKAARFIRYCDAFNIPLITLVDLPGYLPGIDQEHSGVIRHGAKILYAYSEATVPKITLIMRKAYGGGYIAMCSNHLRADFVFAWPTAEIAVMGPEGAANIIFRNEIRNAENPEEVRQQKVKEYKDKFANPYVAAAYGYVDAVIEPEETRNMLIHALDISGEKRIHTPPKKHGIPPF